MLHKLGRREQLEMPGVPPKKRSGFGVVYANGPMTMQRQSSSERIRILPRRGSKFNNTRHFCIGRRRYCHEQTGVKQWLQLDLLMDKALLPNPFAVDSENLMLIDISCYHHGNGKGLKYAAEVSRSTEIDETAGVEDHPLLRESNAIYHISLLALRRSRGVAFDRRTLTHAHLIPELLGNTPGLQAVNVKEARELALPNQSLAEGVIGEVAVAQGELLRSCRDVTEPELSLQLAHL